MSVMSSGRNAYRNVGARLFVLALVAFPPLFQLFATRLREHHDAGRCNETTLRSPPLTSVRMWSVHIDRAVTTSRSYRDLL
jgi:hypothetical protein